MSKWIIWVHPRTEPLIYFKRGAAAWAGLLCWSNDLNRTAIKHQYIPPIVYQPNKLAYILYDIRYDIAERIQYKLCLLVHKSLPGHTPEYISDLLTSVANIPGRSTLRASSCGNLVVPRTRRRICDRTFSVAALRVWNRLPTELKLLRLTDLFRRDLKTFLFHSVYGHQDTDW